MKKLLMLFVLAISSLNAHSEWTEIPDLDSKVRDFIDFNDLKEGTDGYVYWWMMKSDSSSSQKFYMQTDCEDERINPLRVDYHSESMGRGEVTSVKSDEGWSYPARDTALYRFVGVVCDMARETPEKREESISNLLMSLQYKNKINNLYEKEEGASELGALK
jgi:hypothetical protein